MVQREGLWLLRLLHRYRLVLSLALLLVSLYFILYSWLVVPPHALFLGWKPDTVLSVTAIVEAEYAPYVQVGDQVVAIDGQPVRRGQALFSRPWPPSYTFTIIRGGEMVEREVPVITSSSVAPLWKLSQTVLALAFWLIGFLTAFFSRREHHPPLVAGLSFQLIGVGLVSSAPAQFGAPGAWVVGNCLIFLFPAIVLFLALFPRSDPLSPQVRRLLYITILASILLAFVAAVEVLLLFPDNSMERLAGVTMTDILATFAALATAAAVIILVGRMLRAPRGSYQRQQLTILVFFFILALAPLFFLLMLPLREYIFVPYPLLFSLLLLVPAAYFFVLSRQGHLALDALFSRLTTIVVLIVAAGMIYATGSFLLQQVFAADLGDIEQGGLLLILLGSVIAGQKPVQSGVDLLLYGRDALDHDRIHELMARLSANPEPATVEGLLTEIAVQIQLQHAAVLTKQNCRYTVLARTTRLNPFEIAETDAPQQVTLRAKAPERLEALPDWVALAIPIAVREETLGLLLMSRPAAGYFNARQVTRLIEVADVLAFGLLVISLVAGTQQFSQRMLYEKEVQRQQIATEIHNEPLQRLTMVTAKLRENGTNEAVLGELRQVTKDLRQIIAGLRPPALTKSVEWMVREIVRGFAESHTELKVALDIQIENEERLPDVHNNAVYFVLTEALNNVMRHAEAERVHVQLVYTRHTLTMEVGDDGLGGQDVVGLSLNELLRKQHFGMADMYRWASLARGQLEVLSGEHGGTTVKLELPPP